MRVLSFTFILGLLWMMPIHGKSQIVSRVSHVVRASSLTTSNGLSDEFDLLYEDRYFNIENRGLTRVLVYVNGYHFKLAVDPLEVRQGSSTYLMPSQGNITIDIQSLLDHQQNRMKIEVRGPAGADANIVVADQLIGNQVNYVVGFVRLPADIRLSQNFPNPFNPTTTITYEIPRSFTDGVHVQLIIYNLLGQKIQTVVDERNFPGSFVARWDGMDSRGDLVAAGVYLYQLSVGEKQQTKRLILMK